MADGSPPQRDDAKRVPLATDALVQLQNVLNNHREKFEQWHQNVDFGAKPRGTPWPKGYGAMQETLGVGRKEMLGATFEGGRRFKDPQTEMRNSMLQIIGYVENSARDALQSQGRNVDLFSPLARHEEADLPGLISPGAFSDVGAMRDPAVAASLIEAELAAVSKEAKALAEAVKTGPLEMPDGFLEDLEALFRQNSLLKDSQEKYVIDNMRLHNEVTVLQKRVDEIQEGYNELHMKYQQKTRSYNYLQALFDRQNITQEKTAFVREISLLRAQNTDQLEKLAKLTKAYQDLQLESEHKLDQKSKEIAFIAKQNQELSLQHEQDVKQVATAVEKRSVGGDDDSSEDVYSAVSGESSRMQENLSFLGSTLQDQAL